MNSASELHCSLVNSAILSMKFTCTVHMNIFSVHCSYLLHCSINNAISINNTRIARIPCFFLNVFSTQKRDSWTVNTIIYLFIIKQLQTTLWLKHNYNHVNKWSRTKSKSTLLNITYYVSCSLSFKKYIYFFKQQINNI